MAVPHTLLGRLFCLGLLELKDPYGGCSGIGSGHVLRVTAGGARGPSAELGTRTGLALASQIPYFLYSPVHFSRKP